MDETEIAEMLKSVARSLDGINRSLEILLGHIEKDLGYEDDVTDESHGG